MGRAPDEVAPLPGECAPWGGRRPDYQKIPSLKRITLHRATHPIPSERGEEGVRRMLEITKGVGKDDLVVCLISGGGSALMPLPAEGIRLKEKQVVTEMLLNSGATIKEINCVRKHLSGVKGGRLAERLAPANVLSLIISDVVGNDLGSVASGPTVPDETTFADAVSVLRRRRVWRQPRPRCATSSGGV